MKIVVLPDDDIGPEITEAAVRVVDAVDNRFALRLAFEWHEVGMASHRKTGTTLSAATVEAAMSGGLGLSGALNAGESRAAANAGHGSAPDKAGRGLTDPAGLITSTALLLAWLRGRSGRAELSNAGTAIERSVDKILSDPEKRSVDLGGRSGTRDFCDAVVEFLGE